MKTPRALVSILISLSLVGGSPGFDCGRLLAQTFSARTAAAPVSVTAPSVGLTLPADSNSSFAPTENLGEAALSNASHDLPTAAGLVVAVEHAPLPALAGSLGASPAIAGGAPVGADISEVGRSAVMSRFEGDTGARESESDADHPGAFRGLSVPEAPTQDLPLDAAGAQAARNFSAHLGERLSAQGSPEIFLPEAGGVAGLEATGLEPAAIAASLAGQAKSVFKDFKVLVDAEGVASVVFSRVPVSALSLDFIAELDRVVEALSSDRRVKAVVFTGEAGIFLAGADINVLASVTSPGHGARLAANLQRIFDNIENMDKPVVMAVNGHAPGGGLEIALSGHVRIASTRARFKLPEVELGVLPAAGAPSRLPRLVGLTKALDLLISGEPVDAEAARAMGLVDRVVAPEELFSEALKEARRLAKLEGKEKEEFLAAHRTSRIPPRLTFRERVETRFGGWLIKRRAARALPKDRRDYLGSIVKIIDAVLAGVQGGHRAGSRAEAAFFGQLASRPMAKLLTAIALRRLGGSKAQPLDGLILQEVPADASVSDLARESGRPESFLGLRRHALPGLPPLAELIVPKNDGFSEGQRRAQEAGEAAASAALKKEGQIVVVTRDSPGFVVERLKKAYALGSTAGMAREGARLLDEGVVASALDVDIAAVLGAGFPVATGGPLRYSDDHGMIAGRRFYEPVIRERRGSLAARLIAPLLRRLSGISRAFASLLGGGGKAGKGSIEREAAAMMSAGSKKPEAFIPDLYRGALPLSYLSRLPIELEPARQARVDALRTLIAIGLRPRGAKPEADRAALAPLADPSPALRAMLEELGLAPERLREPVLDVHEIDRANDIPAPVLQRMADLGLLRLKIPKEYGGLGLNQREYGQVLRSFAGMSLAIGTVVSAHSTIGSAPLLMFGTPEQKEKYLKMFARGKALASFGLTEPRAGTDLKKLETTATLSEDGKRWRLNGEKLFITGVDDAGLMYIVSGHTVVNGLDLGPSVFIAELPFQVNESWEAKKAKFLELEKRGMRITPVARDGLELMVIRGSDQSFIQLKGFEVPVENVLGPRAANVEGRAVWPEGQGKVVPLLSLNKGRAGFGPYVSEIAAWFATRELEWAVDRKMFDMYSPVEGQPGIQGFMEHPVTKIGRTMIKAAALEAVSERTSALIDDNPELGVATLSAGIKARVTDQTWEIASDALELGGGHALIKGAPNSLEMAFRDTWVTKIGEGVNAALAQLFHLLGGGAVEREMRRLSGAARFLGRWAVNRVFPFFVTDRGGLSRRAAKWIQSRTARFALRFGWTGVRLGKAEFGRRQNTLIRAYNVAMDLFTLASVEDKLARERAVLPKEKVLALEAAVVVLQRNIDRELRFISTSGEPIENLEREVGRAFVAAGLAARGGREDAVERHMRFLHQRADEFYRGLGPAPQPAVQAPAR